MNLNLDDIHEESVGPVVGDRNTHLRGSVNNCRNRFEREKRGHVAFMGGSITQNDGYRTMVTDFLRTRFLETDFTFTNAGIASTCSTTGAFRLSTDVLEQGPVDLFFLEFAVNDDLDAMHPRKDCIRGMEGIIRQLRKHNPCADAAITYFPSSELLEQLQASREPVSLAAHDEVALHYQIATIDLCREIADQIGAGSITWETYGGTHPNAHGSAIGAKMIEMALTEAWGSGSGSDERTPHPMPESPLEPFNHESGRFIDPEDAMFTDDWNLSIPDWESISGKNRPRFTQIPVLSARESGAELCLDFTGTAIGAYILAGPDAGMVEGHVDGEPFETVDLFHRYSPGLHYPRTVIFENELRPGLHRLVLCAAEDSVSGGHACRIMWFVAN